MIRFITTVLLGTVIGIGLKLNPICSGLLYAGISLSFTVIESMIEGNK